VDISCILTEKNYEKLYYGNAGHFIGNLQD